jgi:pyruvate/2-oxoglutarate dehydrogenase complex dihydrolipoamide acyltransferase (E2) component
VRQKYTAQWRYRSSLGIFEEGDVLRLFPEEADYFNRDSPGVLELSEESAESPETVERAEHSSPLDRMVRSGDLETRNVEASPAAVKLAAENDIDLADVEGTGKGGKVTVTDVRKLIE